MNNDLLEKLSAVWTLATGRPLPFLPTPSKMPDDFPVFFPAIGLFVGLCATLIAWAMVWLFGDVAGATLAGILIAFLLELLTAWRGFNGAARLAMRFFPNATDAPPDRFTAQPMFFGALVFIVRAIMIHSVISAGGSVWLTAVFLCAYFAREELSVAATASGAELIKAPRQERHKGAIAGCILILGFILVFRRLWGAAAMFLFSWLVSWYLIKRAENGNPPFDRNLFDTAAYLLETVLLILTVICLHR